MTSTAIAPKGFKLYGYQSEAIDAVRTSWQTIARPAIILPTGTGKTVIFSRLVHDLFVEGKRSIILVHREELVDQTAAKLQITNPNGWRIGVVKADRNDVAADVIVASVQTLYRKTRVDALLAAGRIDAVVCDELHHFASASNRTLLTRLGCFDAENPTLAVGLTATFVRSDAKKLANDWTPVYEKTVAWAIEHNYLVNLTAKQIRVPDLNLGAVRSSRSGDFGDDDLGSAIENSSAAEEIVRSWKAYAADRRTILFAPTIASCDMLVDALNDAGVPTEAVYGHTPSEERKAVYARVRHGITKVLASVGVLTEGFDMPEIAVAILARPTKSRGLYQQMVGRVLRLFPGKDEALLLDVVGNSDENDLCGVTDLTKAHDEQSDKAREPQPCACSGLCCGTRGECTKSKNLGVCQCGDCDCPSSGERGEIRLVHGTSDVEVDVFRGSNSVWLTTDGGTWFIATREAIVCLMPVGDSGTFRAARTHDKRARHSERCGNRDDHWSGTACKNYGCRCAWLGPAADLSTAMSLAERYAEQLDPQVVRRDSSWRRKAPTAAMKTYAQGVGIPVEPGVKAGPVSDALSRFNATRVLKR